VDYDKAYNQRRGEEPSIDRLKEEHPKLGAAAGLAVEVFSDPTFAVSAVGGLAKNAVKESAKYADELLKGGFLPTAKTAKLEAKYASKVDAANNTAEIKATSQHGLPQATKATVQTPKLPVAQNKTIQRPTLTPTLNAAPKASLPMAEKVVQSPTASNVLKDLGADTNRTGRTIGQLNQEYGTIPKGELPRARNVNVPKATQYGETSQYVRTLKESPIVGDQLNKEINDEIIKGSFAKPNISNKTVVDDANTTIQKEGIDKALTRFNAVSESGKQPTSYDIALGNRVLQELQKQGRTQESLNTAVKLTEALSESGRTLQAAKIAKRLSPEGRLMIVARAQKKLSDSAGTNINLPDNIIAAVQNARTEKEIVQANQDAAIAMWNQVPASFTEKANAWRYMSMLFNPKTHVRNIVGNALFVPTREFKNLIGAAIERPTLKVGDRTKAVLIPGKDKSLIDFAKNDFGNVDYILKNEGKYDDALRPQGAKIFDNKALESLRKLNMNAMDKEDTWFMNSAYSSSLAQYMKANKISPANMVGDTLDKGRAYAMNEALKATYRDFNSFANLLNRAKKTLSAGDAASPLANVGKKAAGFGLEGVMPFTKTPFNIAKRGIAYSPAGIARGLANMGTAVRTGKMSASEAIDQLASGISGTGLMGLGMLLGYHGIVNGKEGQYGDKSYDYNQMLGVQNYSISINGKSYTLDWAAPGSMPFFVGVELAKSVKNNDGSLGNAFDAMTQISDPMINLSMLKGMNDLVKNNYTGMGDTALDLATSYVGQFVPTLGGQIARTLDNTRRDTTSTNEVPTVRALQKFGMKQVAKIPGASQKLQPYVDMWGRKQSNGNAAENFLSPGYYSKENITDVDKELLSLKSDLGDSWNDVLPSKVSQYVITSNSMPYRMNESELTAYKTTRGKASYDGLQTLFKSDSYKNMDADGKAKAIKEVYDNATETAKVQYFKSRKLPITNALDKSYQDKFAQLKKSTSISDTDYYAAVKSVQASGTKDIAKAAALQSTLKNVPTELYTSFGISEKTANNAKALTSVGLDVNSYDKAVKEANTNGNAYISKDEAVAYLNSTGYTRAQKRVLIKAMIPNLKKIPY
ncbi:MAG: hypothetical protein WCR33_04930, partial [Bacilli bacterium]